MKLPWYVKKASPPYLDDDGNWVMEITPRRIWFWWLKMRIKHRPTLTIKVDITTHEGPVKMPDPVLPESESPE